MNKKQVSEEEECKHDTIKRIIWDSVVEVFERDENGQLRQTDTYRQWIGNDVVEEYCADCDIKTKDLEPIKEEED